LVWGWVRWIRRPRLWSASPILSLTGLILASLSGVLALSTIAYAQFHHFPFYDPLLLRIFRIGALLSLGGLGFGIAGAWRPNSVRWLSAVSSFGMLIFWIVAASGE
jgi:hypothetical protein